MAVFIAGLPVVATFLGSIFGGILAFFVKFMTKKLAIFSAVLVAITSLTLGFMLVVEGIAAGVVVTFPTDLGNAAFLLPGNFKSCLAAAVSISVARWVYDWNVKIWQYKLNL